MSSPSSSIPTIPQYTLLSSTYTTFKTTWCSARAYKGISTLLPYAEVIAEKVCSATGGYSGASSLTELDVMLKPKFSEADASASPYIETGVEFAETNKDNKYLVNFKKVLPVQTSYSLGKYFVEVFVMNLEKLGKVLKIENPETSAE